MAPFSLADVQVSPIRAGNMDLARRAALWVLTLALLMASAAEADYRDDIGYSRLKTEVASDLPDGSGVPVSHIEAAARSGEDLAWMPNPGHPEFAGKRIINESLAPPGIYSRHADGTGLQLYGNRSSISPGITQISSYLSTHWLGQGLIRTGSTESAFQLQPRASASRLGNHSWVGATDGFDLDVLSRVDWVIDRDEFVQVTGYTGSRSQVLLSSAYNVIAVNRSEAETLAGSAGAGGIYTAGRSKPDLVAPASHTSQAVPRIAAAVALLIDASHEQPGLSTDPEQQSVTNRNGDNIFNAERSEVLKAALMAGAERQTRNSSGKDLVDYRVHADHRTANGLDRRYGAGQLNIYNSYKIITAGEQNSREDSRDPRIDIGLAGFDFDPVFGGIDNSNARASYYFSTRDEPAWLQASLVWNLAIAGGSAFSFDPTPTLHDLDLLLFDITDPKKSILVASSASATDNTENLWTRLEPDKNYMLRVTPGARQQSFGRDYALAWIIRPPAGIPASPQ